jgi:uncharacterized protein (TIGR00730 family)
MINSVCVYCGSSPGNHQIYIEAGRALGRAIAASGLRLVYGAGTRGVMGALAEGAREAGGKITGIIPRFLVPKEATAEGLSGLDDLLLTEDMHQRKHAMFERSDAFVALPGGIGTAEEIVEIMTWAQLGRHRKPVVLANIAGFWDPFLAFMDHMKAEGFIHTAHRVRPIVVEDAADVVPAILQAASETETDAGGDAAVIERM